VAIIKIVIMITIGEEAVGMVIMISKVVVELLIIHRGNSIKTMPPMGMNRINNRM